MHIAKAHNILKLGTQEVNTTVKMKETMNSRRLTLNGAAVTLFLFLVRGIALCQAPVEPELNTQAADGERGAKGPLERGIDGELGIEPRPLSPPRFIGNEDGVCIIPHIGL